MFSFTLPGDTRRPFWENVIECHTSKCDLKLNIIIVEGTKGKKTQTVQLDILNIIVLPLFDYLIMQFYFRYFCLYFV